MEEGFGSSRWRSSEIRWSNPCKKNFSETCLHVQVRAQSLIFVGHREGGLSSSLQTMMEKMEQPAESEIWQRFQAANGEGGFAQQLAELESQQLAELDSLKILVNRSVG